MDATKARIFICHASEDKKAVARPLAKQLQKLSFDVWYDEFSIKMGDSLRGSIDKGLAKCDFGVVVLSTSFFDKMWPQEELAGLTSKEISKKGKVILPIWHDIDFEIVNSFSPTLAGRYGIASSNGPKKIAAFIEDAIVHEELRRGVSRTEFVSAAGGRLAMEMRSNTGPSLEEGLRAFDSKLASEINVALESLIDGSTLKKK